MLRFGHALMAMVFFVVPTFAQEGPVSWQQFINPVDLLIVYAVENVG